MSSQEAAGAYDAAAKRELHGSDPLLNFPVKIQQLSAKVGIVESCGCVALVLLVLPLSFVVVSLHENDYDGVNEGAFK